MCDRLLGIENVFPRDRNYKITVRQLRRSPLHSRIELLLMRYQIYIFLLAKARRLNQKP